MQWLLSSGVTAGGLAGLAFMLVLTGRLVPRKQVQAQVQQAQHDAEQWQRAAEKQSDRADLAVQQMGTLLTGLATVEALLRALQPPGRGRR